MKPTPNEVNEALRGIERTERPANHPRVLAHKAVAQYRRTAAADYKFENAPRELRQVVYDATVRYHVKRSLLARLFRR